MPRQPKSHSSNINYRDGQTFGGRQDDCRSGGNRMASVAELKRADSLFFGAIAGLLIGYVLLGFWPSYFVRGLIMAPLPNLLVQVHALLFVGWMVMFAMQIVLVGNGRTASHRRVGQLMAWWAVAIAIVGPATVLMAVRRGAKGVGPGPLAGDLAQSLAFAILIATGLHAADFRLSIRG